MSGHSYYIKNSEIFISFSNAPQCGVASFDMFQCGLYIHGEKNAPDKCPACVRPTGYFELFVQNW